MFDAASPDRRLTTLVYVTAVVSSLVAAVEATGANSSVDIDRLVNEINDTMSCRHVPGLSIAIVHDGRTVMARGLGRSLHLSDVKRLTERDGGGRRGRRGASGGGGGGGEREVDEKSKFVIASLSKAFTATLVGMLLEEQLDRFPRGWYTPVAEIMGPDFRFADDLRTKQVTVRDLLSHKTGLPGYKMALMVGLESGHTRQDICRRIRYLNMTEPYTMFRSKFEYNNLMYHVAGCLAEKLGGGQQLETLMANKLFRPLGMNDTHLMSQMSDDDQRFVLMYQFNRNTSRLEPLDQRIIRTVQPMDAAGGVISTAVDMSRWLQFHLNGGRDQAGNQLLPAREWMQMHSPHNAIDVPSPTPVVRPWFPVTDTYSSYGLGWRLGHYRGYKKSEHTGRLASFDTKITIIRDAKLAVYTATNGPLWDGKEFHTVVHYRILDTFLNETASTYSSTSPTSFDWLNATTLCTYPLPWSSRLPTMIPNVSLPVQNVPAPPSVHHWLANSSRLYVGRYGHLFFGNFTVSFHPMPDTFDGGQLTFAVGRIGSGRLLYSDGVTWLMAFDDTVYFTFGPPYLGIPLPIVFHDQEPSSGPEGGPFRAVVVLPFEPAAAPVYRRDVRWDDDGRSASSQFGWSGLLLLALIVLADGVLPRSGC